MSNDHASTDEDRPDELTSLATEGRTKLLRRNTPPKNVVGFREALADVGRAEHTFGLPDVHPAALEIGQTIRRLRTARGMTQVDLATAAGISQAALSAIELGKGSDGPSFRILREISRSLGLQVLQADPLGEAVEIKADPPDVISIAEGQTECETFHPSIDGFIRGLFDDNELKALCSKLQKFPSTRSWRKAVDDYQCSVLRVDPHAHMRVETHAPAVFVVLNGELKMRPVQTVNAKRSYVNAKRGYVVKGKETVEVVNPLSKASSLLSVPAACFLSVARE